MTDKDSKTETSKSLSHTPQRDGEIIDSPILKALSAYFAKLAEQEAEQVSQRQV